ncbi:MAG TPA: carboxypeptidase-like regulatory domain-containing protein, partial [Abditibacterium sp.]
MLKFSLPAVVFVGFLSASARADAVRLQIVGPDKKPVAGARVRVLEYEGYQPDGRAVALDLVSDGDGKIAFQTKKPLTVLDKKLRPASPQKVFYMVSTRVLAPGFAVATPRLHAGDNSLTLDAGATFGGAVFDEEQRPVAGIKIVARSFSDAKNSARVYLPGALQLETRSDAAGNWSFDSVPRAGMMAIEAVSPRFVREWLQVSLAAPSAPPLYLERGATIKGRLLRPDGRPAAGVALSPIGRSYFGPDTETKTAPDGRFELFGLRAGDFSVQHLNYRSREVESFIVGTRQVRALKEGEIRDIGDWKTEAGVLATGKIIESGTKKPIADASLYTYGNGSFHGQSDERGLFTLRVLRNVRNGHISARGFVPVRKTWPKIVGTRLDVGTIEMKRGLVVKGVLKDQNGRPLAERQVYVDGNRGNRSYGYTNEKGEFTLEGMEPGTFSLKLDSGKLVAAVPIVAIAGKVAAPVVAIAQTEAEADKNATKKLAGIALDGAGKPVAGVKIEARLTRSNSSQRISAISGADGRFEAESFLEGAVPTLVSTSRPGLIFAGGGEWTIVEGVWQTELRFQLRGQVTRGRVVDGAGKPVARVWVSVPAPILNNLKMGGEVPVTRSDDNGEFALVDAAPVG